MKKLFLAITLAILQLGYAQSDKEALKKAAQYYKNLDYVQAINAYELMISASSIISNIQKFVKKIGY